MESSIVPPEILLTKQDILRGLRRLDELAIAANCKVSIAG